eukprot:CAMPEP_0113836846 /NCGR_PEP_ID=MMETSP0328-20130328/9688_1 /TAXON_ID=39455 /ORGANISM="Alexandrium minutum" /LENGTH=132 /DNA_ID=CAMNT_0000805269 /DNA_START=99 /DNA_END=494 /DNA_ORIENTATION=+ /assembly_acc=CAM_ASM_000350
MGSYWSASAGKTSPVLVRCYFAELSDDMEQIASELPTLPSGYRGSDQNVVWHGLRQACKRYSENSGNLNDAIQVWKSAGPGAGSGHGCEVKAKIRDIFKDNLDANACREQSIAAIYEAEKNNADAWQDRATW